ncbi:cell division protein FtsK, partial [Micromonospora sp. NPDC051296]
MTTAGDLMVIRPRRLELPLWLIALGLVLRWLFRAAVWCVRHPVIVGLVVAGVLLYAEFGRAGLIVPLVLAAFGS